MPLPPSASDWTRVKNLQQVSRVNKNFGSSNVRNPASYETDRIAASKFDFTFVSEIPVKAGSDSFGSFGREIKVESSRCISCNITPLQKHPTYKSSLYQHLRLR